MAGYCVSFLFYSYASATIIYLILAIMASTGNQPLLMEHYHYNEKNEVIEGDEKEVKLRTLREYFLGASLTLVISVLLFIFFMREKKQDKGLFNQIINIESPQDINIVNQPENVELSQPQPQPSSSSGLITDDNNIQAINTVNTIGSGMGENEI